MKQQKANSRYKDEKKTSQKLGLVPVAMSGSRFEARQDGECACFLMQHKSTRGKSISVLADDVDDLLQDARVTKKIPLFVLEFVRDVVLGPYEAQASTMVAIPIERLDDFARTWLAHMGTCRK